MSERSAHVRVWKDRLHRALTDRPVSTTALAASTAVPRRTALVLLNELAAERIALKTTMPRMRAGAHADSGWRLAGAAT